MVSLQDISLHYGMGRIVLRVPTGNVQAVVRPWTDSTHPATVDPLMEVLRGAAGQALRRRVAGKRLCVLVPDSTRLTPFTAVWPAIMDLCVDCAAMRFILSTGTHCSDTPANRVLMQAIRQAANPTGGTRVQVAGHHCREAVMGNAGTTSRGTPVLYNRWLDEADAFLALSDVKVHYFAGYSNPIKNIVPGVCAYATVEANHSWTLHANATYGRHPWHRRPERRDNPLAQDQLEAMGLIVGARPFYALVTVGVEGRANWAALGSAEEVAGVAFDMADSHNTHTLPVTQRLVVSPGGHPDDVDLYIAQRALELTQAVLAPGAELLFLAACPGGVGEVHTLENFYRRLIKPLDEIRSLSREDYVLFSHKPYRFARLIDRLRRLWVYSEMPPEQIQAMHMTPTANPQAVVDEWLAQDPACRITFVDGANKIALYAQVGVEEARP